MARIGDGSKDSVYIAVDRTLDRTVAVKTLPLDKLNDATSVQRFKREGVALSKLNHSNLVSIFDVGVMPDGLPYMVMEHLEGTSLAALLQKEQRLELGRCARLFGQICDGLQHAHAQNIIHRNLKPNNAMIVRENDREAAKIVDFGIAKVIVQEQQDRGTALTRPGEIFGSPLYMSPEQCRGLAVDARSDQYSFGCMLYESLTGEVPHLGATSAATLLKKQKDEVPSLREASGGIEFPESTEALVQKLLAKEPAARFGNMLEVKEAMVTALPSTPSSTRTAHPDSSPSSLSNPQQTSPSNPRPTSPHDAAVVSPLNSLSSSPSNSQQALPSNPRPISTSNSRPSPFKRLISSSSHLYAISAGAALVTCGAILWIIVHFSSQDQEPSRSSVSSSVAKSAEKERATGKEQVLDQSTAPKQEPALPQGSAAKHASAKGQETAAQQPVTIHDSGQPNQDQQLQIIDETAARAARHEAPVAIPTVDQGRAEQSGGAPGETTPRTENDDALWARLLKNSRSDGTLDLPPQLKDTDLQRLKDATWLEAIICYNNPKITSRGVQILQKLPKLKRLQFGHTERITDDVIKGLSQIKSLHNIKIVDCNSSGIHFSYLKSLPAFDRLTLKSVALDNVSLSQACELPHALSFENIGKNLDWQLLKKFRGDNLIFKFCALEPQMFAAMGKAENLQGLFVEHCSLDPRCMHELKSARKLVVLSLHNTNVTDECVSEITNLPSLRSIDLSDTKITGKSLKLLERLHSLRLLLVWGNTPIKNSAALQDFREHRPEVRLASTSEEGKQLRAFGL